MLHCSLQQEILVKLKDLEKIANFNVKHQIYFLFLWKMK